MPSWQGKGGGGGMKLEDAMGTGVSFRVEQRAVQDLCSRRL